jgi:hypothetical protein
MKNKILCIVTALLFSFCFMNYSVAEETEDLNTVIQASSMPSDAEIMETIRKFNFSKAQEEYLFKETKRKLTEMYSNKDFRAVTAGETTLKTDKEVKTKRYQRKSKTNTNKDELIQIPENN